MKNKIIDSIGNIDNDIVESVARIRRKKHRNSVWIKIGAIAACLCLVTVIVYIIPKHINQSKTTENTTNTNIVSNIYIGDQKDLIYHEANADDRIRYGLPGDISEVVISKSDLGEYIGNVGGVMNDMVEDIVGKKVYHYARFPELKSIVIIEIDESYAFFCTYGYTVNIDIGESMGNALNSYELPERGVKIEIYNCDGELVRIASNKSDMETLVDVLKGSNNIGFEELNRRLVSVWYERYGNDYVYLDEEGFIAYKDVSVDGEDTDDKANASGVIGTESEKSRVPVKDLANELWRRDAFELVIEDNQGFRIILNYMPASGTISAFDGVFALTEEDMTLLETIIVE